MKHCSRPIGRRSRIQLVIAAAAVLSTIVLSGKANAQSLIFDNLSAFETDAPGAAAAYDPGPGETIVGGNFSLPGGTISLSGFDVAVINDSATTVPDLQVNIYVWGSVNTGPFSSTTPAFSNLLGSYSTDLAVNLAQGDYKTLQSGEPGANPGIALATPLMIPVGTTGIGVSYGFESSSTLNGVYAPKTGLTSLVTYGVPPTTDLSGSYYPYFFYNTGGETNGNFNEGPYTFNDPDNEMAARIYGTIAVPEPKGLALLGVAAIGSFRRRGRAFRAFRA